MNKLTKDILEKVDVDASRIVYINLQSLSDSELAELIDSASVFNTLSKLFREIQNKKIEEIHKQIVSTNVLDISEKIEKAQDIIRDRMWYTITVLGRLAQAELIRRKKKSV